MGNSFWRYLFDSDWQQRRDIENLRDQLAESYAAQASADTYAGGFSIGDLRRQIHELSATVMILVEMLAEAGALDREKLRARVEGVLENSREERPSMPDPWRPAPDEEPPVGTGDPYRQTPAEAGATVKCSYCQRTVPERLTVITGQGTICDVCAAKGV